MAGYRRFIAYVYDYESGKKGSNCGFIKVEVKDQQCSVEIHLHCPGPDQRNSSGYLRDRKRNCRMPDHNRCNRYE